MKQLTITFVIAMLLTGTAVTQAARGAGSSVYVDVNGLVCDFCAQALEKVFRKQEAVSDVDVNLDTKVVTISFNNGMQLEDDFISKLVKDAGYNVVKIRHQKEGSSHGAH